MSDHSGFSVDDILKEVREMRGEKPAEPPAPSAPVRPAPVQEKKDEPAPVAEPVQEKEPEPAPVVLDEPEQSEDKLKKFLSKSHESDYSDSRADASKDAKAQIGLLFDDEGETLDASEVFTVGKKRRAPHALTKDELLGTPDKTMVFDAIKPSTEKVDVAKEQDEISDLFSQQRVKGFTVKGEVKHSEKIDGFTVAKPTPEPAPAPVVEEQTMEFDAVMSEAEEEFGYEEEKKGFFARLFGRKKRDDFEEEYYEETEEEFEEPQEIEEPQEEIAQPQAEIEPEFKFEEPQIEPEFEFKEPEFEPELKYEEPQIEPEFKFEEPEVEVEEEIEEPHPITIEEPQAEPIAVAIDLAFEEPEVEPEPIKIQKRELPDEPEEEVIPEPQDDEFYEEIDDYASVEDATAVREDLARNCGVVSRKFTVSLLVLLALVAVNFLPMLSSLSPMILLGINIALVAILIFNDFANMFRGLGALITFRANADSAIAAASFAALGQSIYLLCVQDTLQSGLPLCTTFAAVAAVFAYWGKHVLAARVRDNFELIANDNVKQVCCIANEADAEAVAGDAAIGEASLCFDKSVINVQNFLTHSFCQDPVDRMSRLLAPISLVAAVITSLLMVFFINADLPTAINAGVLVLCLGTPATSLLASNMPLRGASRKLREVGGVITGYDAVQEFADVNAVAVDAEELFPAGSVELLGMKNYGETAIDKTLLDAAAVAIHAGGPLADVFDKIIEGRRKILPKVTQLEYEDGLGISGRVGEKVLRIGTRAMMEKYFLSGLPDSSYDTRVALEGKSLVYLSVGDVLAGVFLVQYNINDEDLLYSVGNLIDSGVSLVVKTCDANITSSLIAKLFDVDEEMIRIMPSDAVAHYDRITAPARDHDGLLIHNNSMTAYAMLLTASHRLRGSVMFATVLQTIGVLLGFAGGMFLALSGTFAWLAAGTVIMYQLAVALVTVLLPALRGI